MAETPYYVNGVYQPGQDPRPYTALNPQEQGLRNGPNISPASIQPVQPLPITDAPDSGLHKSVVAGADTAATGIQSYINTLTPPQKSDTQVQSDTIQSEINNLLGQDTGRGAAQIQAENTAGVDVLKKNLSDIQSQILTKSAEYKALSTQVEGKPITMNSIIGEQAQIQKAQASELGLLTAQSEAVQGRLDSAISTANRAVDLKYADVESQLNAKYKQLDLLKGNLSKEDKLRSDALSLYLDQQKTDLQEKKAKDKALESVIAQALSNGAPLSVVSQARQMIANNQTDAALASLHTYTGTRTADTNYTSTTSTPGSNKKLTLSEANSLALPTSLVGRSETNVMNEISTSPSAPKWFSDLVPGAYVLSPGMLQSYWTKFQSQFKQGKAKIPGGTAPSSTSNGGTDYGALNLPSPVQ